MRRFRLMAAVVLAIVVFILNTAVVYAAEKEETAGSVLLSKAGTLLDTDQLSVSAGGFQ